MDDKRMEDDILCHRRHRTPPASATNNTSVDRCTLSQLASFSEQEQASLLANPRAFSSVHEPTHAFLYNHQNREQQVAPENYATYIPPDIPSNESTFQHSDFRRNIIRPQRPVSSTPTQHFQAQAQHPHTDASYEEFQPRIENSFNIRNIATEPQTENNYVAAPEFSRFESSPTWNRESCNRSWDQNVTPSHASSSSYKNCWKYDSPYYRQRSTQELDLRSTEGKVIERDRSPQAYQESYSHQSPNVRPEIHHHTNVYHTLLHQTFVTQSNQRNMPENEYAEYYSTAQDYSDYYQRYNPPPTENFSYHNYPMEDHHQWKTSPDRDSARYGETEEYECNINYDSDAVKDTEKSNNKRVEIVEISSLHSDTDSTVSSNDCCTVVLGSEENDVANISNIANDSYSENEYHPYSPGHSVTISPETKNEYNTTGETNFESKNDDESHLGDGTDESIYDSEDENLYSGNGRHRAYRSYLYDNTDECISNVESRTLYPDNAKHQDGQLAHPELKKQPPLHYISSTESEQSVPAPPERKTSNIRLDYRRIRKFSFEYSGKNLPLRLAHRAYTEKRYNDFFRIVKENTFPKKYQKRLRIMWFRAHYFNHHKLTQMPITAVARFHIRNCNPPPSTILETWKSMATEEDALPCFATTEKEFEIYCMRECPVH